MPENAPFTEAEWERLKQLLRDYEQSTAVGRWLWRVTLVVGGFLVGLATILAAISTIFHNFGAPK